MAALSESTTKISLMMTDLLELLETYMDSMEISFNLIRIFSKCSMVPSIRNQLNENASTLIQALKQHKDHKVRKKKIHRIGTLSSWLFYSWEFNHDHTRKRDFHERNGFFHACF
jgi:hypothetical protein